MSSFKQRISSPLEAGRSILDAHNIAPHLTEALDYTSRRLARKAQHITLILVRNESQLPSILPPPCATPTSPPATPEYMNGFASPTRFTSPMGGWRQLVRRGTSSSLASTASASSSSTTTTTSSEAGSSMASPMFSPHHAEPLNLAALGSPRRWIMPPTPGSPPPLTPYTPMTPLTPYTPGSIATSTASTSCTSNMSPSQTYSPTQGAFGVRLVYTSPLSPKADKALRATLDKAHRKYGPTLPAVSTASASGLNADLVRRSILQNEVLYSAEGLTLLGLDRLYCFKAALAAYAKSLATLPPTPLGSPGLSNHPVLAAKADSDSTKLEDAVDSLRRLVLSNGGRQVQKSDIYRSYDWMGVFPRALADVERMYRRAYGGLERRGPFVEVLPARPSPGAVRSFRERVVEVAQEGEFESRGKMEAEEETQRVEHTDDAEVTDFESDKEVQVEVKVRERRAGIIKIGSPPPRRTQTPRARTPSPTTMSPSPATIIEAKKLEIRADSPTVTTTIMHVTPSSPMPTVRTPKSATPKAHTPILKLDTNIVKPRVVKPIPNKVPPPIVRMPEPAVVTSDKTGPEGPETNDIEICISAIDLSPIDRYREEEEGDRTARPVAERLFRSSGVWGSLAAAATTTNDDYQHLYHQNQNQHQNQPPQNASGLLGAGLSLSIDEMLSPISPIDARLSQRLGPTTPNGYDDISPITRGEWGFLFKGDGWTGGRTAAVETW
ncbi:hypothetical protein F5Y15DRAFT_43452 [Xylariaceae sp. FL0016]|nr:hypothetical protein F5Y15DRAFT_43452 [Xylariaceae sp. FL0016]